MQIKIASDIHLEFSEFMINNNENCDVLVLPGDIFMVQDLHDYPVTSEYQSEMGSRQRRAKLYRKFLSRCSDLFPEVIYVAGNHEFYKGKWHAGLTYLADEIDKYSNIHFLENDTKIIDDVVFIGGTLWTDMNKRDPVTLLGIINLMTDFGSIRNDKRSYKALTPADTVVRHFKTKEYFSTALEEHKDKKCVVVSHHAPSELSCAAQYKNETTMNGGFYSDLNDFILDRPQIKVWTHGHTHTAFDYMLGDTRVICNPRGYETYNFTENPSFDPDKIIEL